MKITVLQEHLLSCVSLASHFLPNKLTTVPSLSNFLMSVEKEKITLTASNIETTIETTIPGKVEKEGAVLIPGKTLLSLLPAFSGEKITIEEQDKKIILLGKGTEVSLKTEDAHDYPKQTGDEKEKEIELSRRFIASIAQRVCLAASIDQTRAILTSVLIEDKEEGLFAVATDGFRLSVYRDKTEKRGLLRKINVPSKVISVVASILKEEEKESIKALYYEKSSRISFLLPGVKVTTQLIDGAFPDYKKIIPTSVNTSVTFGREDGLRALKFASVFARDASNIVKLKTENQKLVVSAKAAQTGENKTEIPATIEGEPVEVAFNYRFLADFFSSVEDETVLFETNGALLPGVFTTPKNKNHFYIVMPVRLQEN